jgi:hypothetical protein
MSDAASIDESDGAGLLNKRAAWGMCVKNSGDSLPRRTARPMSEVYASTAAGLRAGQSSGESDAVEV